MKFTDFFSLFRRPCKIKPKPVASHAYRNGLKDREFGKKAPQNFDPERVTIAERQGASEDRNSAGKPTRPKTDSSSHFGITRGEHYDLKSIYDWLNAYYFDNRLDLRITWFGCPHRKVRRQRILGLYDFQNRLIKVHRLLDHPRFPPYFISYIVYHEMLHCVLPPLKRKRGRHRIHHVEFKEREKTFVDYERAREFEKKNLNLFFMSKDQIYGRS